jgi:hypothetical protein
MRARCKHQTYRERETRLRRGLFGQLAALLQLLNVCGSSLSQNEKSRRPEAISGQLNFCRLFGHPTRRKNSLCFSPLLSGFLSASIESPHPHPPSAAAAAVGLRSSPVFIPLAELSQYQQFLPQRLARCQIIFFVRGLFVLHFVLRFNPAIQPSHRPPYRSRRKES